MTARVADSEALLKLAKSASEPAADGASATAATEAAAEAVAAATAELAATKKGLAAAEAEAVAATTAAEASASDAAALRAEVLTLGDRVSVLTEEVGGVRAPLPFPARPKSVFLKCPKTHGTRPLAGRGGDGKAQGCCVESAGGR